MTIDYLNIGPTPYDETSAQVGVDPQYDTKNRQECSVFQRMLERLFKAPEDDKTRFVVKTFSHEFGTYREVCARFDSDDEASSRFAIDVECDSPGSWDAIALSELEWFKQREDWWAKVTAGTLPAEQVPSEFQAVQPPEPSNEALAACQMPPIGILRQRLLQNS